MKITRSSIAKQDAPSRKRSRSSMNFIAEGIENEEPVLKKCVSRTGNKVGQIKVSNSTIVVLEESIRSQSSSVQKPSLSLTLVPPILPKSWYATQDIAWAPEDHETYAWAILEQMLFDERKYVLTSPVFEQIQNVVTPTSHNCMFNFLCEVSQDQRLSYTTFLHAMHLFDFVLSRICIGRHDFLVTGCACLLLASKLEEIYPPTSDSLMSHSNFIFSKAELFQAERNILEMMEFKVTRPTRLHFAEYLGKINKVSKRQAVLLQYLVGLSMLDYDLNYYKCSVVAAAAFSVTLQLTNVSRNFSNLLKDLSETVECSVEDLQCCIAHIRMIHLTAHSGTDLPVILPLSADCMRRATTRKTPQGATDTQKALSPQLLEWFSSEETLEVTEITALPLYDLDLSLLVNRCVGHKDVAVQGTQLPQPKTRLSPSSSGASLSTTWQSSNMGNKGGQLRASSLSSSAHSVHPNAIAMANELGIGL